MIQSSVNSFLQLSATSTEISFTTKIFTTKFIFVEEEEVTKSHLAEFRERIQTCASGWILLLSIPPLVMLAHLQNLVSNVPVGGGGSGKPKPPSIQPNDYMDSLLEDIKTSMKER